MNGTGAGLQRHHSGVCGHGSCPRAPGVLSRGSGHQRTEKRSFLRYSRTASSSALRCASCARRCSSWQVQQRDRCTGTSAPRPVQARNTRTRSCCVRSALVPQAGWRQQQHCAARPGAPRAAASARRCACQTLRAPGRGRRWPAGGPRAPSVARRSRAPQTDHQRAWGAPGQRGSGTQERARGCTGASTDSGQPRACTAC